MRLLLVLAVSVVLPLRAAPETQSEYKQADTSYYLRGEVFAADPAAAIIAPAAATNIGGTYLISTRGRAPQFVYLEDTHDWIEPITPPSEPASLNISPMEMQVREPQGSVQAALASAPADFHDVEPAMKLTDGAVLRTGDNGSVAVLFGGVDSVRLAPNTEAAVQMKLEGGKRNVEIDVRKGMVFSKVGSRPGEKQAYAVHTPFGDATAHGTDYVTVVYPQRVDVWVAQGTVQLVSPGGLMQTTISDGKSPLKVMRNPAAKNSATALAESAESLTALLNFIPLANRKLQALAERTQSGAHLTATEKDYVGRIRKVVSLIKLANISAPSMPVAAPTSPPALQAVVTTPPVAKPPLRALPVEADSVAPTVVHAAEPKPAIPAKVPAVAKAAPAAKPANYKTKPVVIVLPPAHFPKTAPDADEMAAKAAKNAVAKTTGAKTPNVAKTAAPTKTAAKTKTASTVAAAKPKPATGSPYLRAKAVDADELAEVPSVESTPPTPRKSSTEVDPNSLGAPLQPMRPVLTPRPPEPAASDAMPAPTKPAASYSVP